MVRVGQYGHRSGLREGLELKYAGYNRVAWKVPGQPSLVAGDPPASRDRPPWIAMIDRIDEPERGPVL